MAGLIPLGPALEDKLLGDGDRVVEVDDRVGVHLRHVHNVAGGVRLDALHRPLGLGRTSRTYRSAGTAVVMGGG